MAKREHVPETRSVPNPGQPNREQRRHPERLEDAPLARDTQPSVVEQGPQDVQSVRAKNSGHKKKTADKWNQ
jgi:hypothetical protein